MNAERDDPSVPRWLAEIVTAANLAVIGFGMAGLLAAVLGWFRPWLVLPLGGLATIVLWRLTRREHTEARVTPFGSSCAVALVAFVVLTSAYSIRHGAEHVEINRDPGFYVNAAKWLDRDGSLEVQAEVGPFETAKSLGYSTPGLPEPEPGTLNFQGNHLLPVLMAEGGWLGGDAAMFGTPIALGGVALLSIYVLIASRTSPLPALAATVALGSSVLWIAFSRDAYTEVPSVALVAFALWRLPRLGGAPAPGVAAQIGVALGALGALRIDAPLLWMLWPLIVAGWWSSGFARERAGRATGALMMGFGAALVIALADLLLRSSEYASDLAARTVSLWAAFAAVGVLTVVVVAIPQLQRVASRVGNACSSSSRLRAVLAILVALGGFGLWFVRPRIETVRGTPQRSVAALQELLGVPIDITRKYSERSFEWQAWYLGPLLVALGIAGLAFSMAMRSRFRRLLPVVLTTAPASILYLYRPNIFPDHTWVMRRFLTTLTLLLVVGAAVTLDALSRLDTPRRALRGATVATIAIAMVVMPAWSSRTVRAAADQRGYLAGVEQACEVLGPRAAVIVIRNEDDALFTKIPQALRGWCDVPVAIAGASFTPSVLRVLTEAWDVRGRTLTVMAAGNLQLQRLCPGAPSVRVEAENRFLLEQTLTRRPRGYTTQSLEFEIVQARHCNAKR
jgi:hypothetical protein